MHRPPTGRKAHVWARWIMTNPGHLTEDDAQELKRIRAGSPELDAAPRRVSDFAATMRDLRGDQLPNWMDRVLADDPPALHSLVNASAATWTPSLPGGRFLGVPDRSRPKLRASSSSSAWVSAGPTSASFVSAYSSPHEASDHKIVAKAE
jgi:hypothetical protein